LANGSYLLRDLDKPERHCTVSPSQDAFKTVLEWIDLAIVELGQPRDAVERPASSEWNGVAGLLLRQLLIAVGYRCVLHPEVDYRVTWRHEANSPESDPQEVGDEALIRWRGAPLVHGRHVRPLHEVHVDGIRQQFATTQHQDLSRTQV